MARSLEGRVAVLTGAGTAVGGGIARRLASDGAALGLVSEHGDALGVADELRAAGTRVEVVEADLSDRRGAIEGFASLAASLGGIDAFVHAAVDQRCLVALELDQVDDARFDAVWELGMRRVLFGCQAAFAHMAGGGRMVFVVPTLAMTGASGLAPYAALGEATRLLAKSAARQWGPEGVTVNCLAVAPELILGRPAEADPGLAPPALGTTGDAEADVAPVVSFLMSAAGHFVTGATICADGGVWMAP